MDPKTAPLFLRLRTRLLAGNHPTPRKVGASHLHLRLPGVLKAVPPPKTRKASLSADLWKGTPAAGLEPATP